MGQVYRVKCAKCGEECSVSIGGGFVFHLLHCDQCGKDKSIPFDEIGEVHLRYLKGLPGPYSVATSEQDRAVQENYPGDSLSEEEYHKIVEEMPEPCQCGGRFRFEAPPRCAMCRSSELSYDENSPEAYYD